MYPASLTEITTGASAPVRLSLYIADAWWQCEPPDALGYQWRSPGVYIVARDVHEQIQSLVRIDFLDGKHADIQDAKTWGLAAEILHAMRRMYQHAG